MAKKPHYDPKANTRLAWLWSNAWGKNKTDVEIIMELMQAFPGLSEQTARKDLARACDHFAEINKENEHNAAAQCEKQIRDLLNIAVNALQLSAAAKFVDQILRLKGLGDSKSKPQTPADENEVGTMDPDMIRERMRDLWNRKSTHENAEEIGFDLKQLAEDAGFKPR